MLRLFVAIELNDAVKRAMQQVRRSLARFDDQVRWVRPEQMHLTMKFLGEVADACVPVICESVELAASTIRPFDVATESAGCFPPRGPVRVIWLGLRDAEDALTACWSALDEALAEAGQPKDTRPFSAHLTVGRVRGDQSRGNLRTAVEALTPPEADQAVAELVLMQSSLSPKGATYTRLGAWPLVKAPASSNS